MLQLLEPSPMIDLPVGATLGSVRSLTPRERLFELELDEGYELDARPGQFVMVSVLGTGEAPISITSAPRRGRRFDLCIRDAGTLTHYLHTLQPGARIGVRGPFGTGFPVDEMIGFDMLFVAGGLGLAPLRSLILTTLENRQHFGKITILYGTRAPEDRLFAQELQAWSDREDVDFDETVDVGDVDWRGKVGVITTLFKGRNMRPGRTIAAVCGPPVMYKFVVMELLGRGFLESRVFLSLERRMCCGMGKCGQCQINGEYVCQSGPVYRYLDAKRLREAL